MTAMKLTGVLVAGMLALPACSGGGHPGAAPTPRPAATRPLVAAADVAHLQVVSSKAYVSDKVPVQVNGRRVTVLSQSSFALQVGDNGNCQPSVKTAEIREPGTLTITLNRGRCFELNLVPYVLVVDLSEPVFFQSEHGQPIRNVLLGEGRGAERLGVVR